MSDNPGESGWHAELDQEDLTEDRVPADPMALFATWFEQARAAAASVRMPHRRAG